MSPSDHINSKPALHQAQNHLKEPFQPLPRVPKLSTPKPLGPLGFLYNHMDFPYIYISYIYISYMHFMSYIYIYVIYIYIYVCMYACHISPFKGALYDPSGGAFLNLYLPLHLYHVSTSISPLRKPLNSL